MKILFAGESWVKHIIHVKGFDSFTTSEFDTGHKWFENAMKNKGIEMDLIPSHEVPESFPFTLEELEGYDAIILSDIGSRSFLLPIPTFTHSEVIPNRLQLIKRYVENGGGFAMIGGYMSFQGFENKGKYSGTVIEEILPVNLMTSDDTQEYPEGLNIEVVEPNHPLFKGVLSEWPHFLGYNKFTAKEDSTVLAKYEDDPFIVVGEYGKGRTLAFASDLAPHWGPKEFVEWECYEDFWANVVNWLGKNTSI